MIDILMATYNGEAFVEEQVRSIMNQSYSDWRLLVHDDGSTDHTIAILRRLSKQDSRIILIEDGIHGLGIARHFIHMLQYSDAPYCMFCDQDDIWLPSKVQTMYEAIRMLQQDCPQVVYANAYVWCPQQGIISHQTTLTYPTTLRQMLFLNTGIQGASAIFNRAMCKCLRTPLDSYAMHDHALLLAGICLGKVQYIHQPLMYYRQHAHNATGHTAGSIWKKISHMWSNRHIPLVSQLHMEGVRAFFTCFHQALSAEDKQLIEVFLQMPHQSFVTRLANIIRYQFQLFDSTLLLVIKLCIRRYI